MYSILYPTKPCGVNLFLSADGTLDKSITTPLTDGNEANIPQSVIVVLICFGLI
jgi:hypothetical protein